MVRNKTKKYILYNVDLLNGIFVYGFFAGFGTENRDWEFAMDEWMIFIRSLMRNKYRPDP